MSWRRIEAAAVWDAATLRLPPAHALQRWAWGEFKSHWGWTAERWLLDDADGPRAAVQLLRRRIGPLAMLYAPRGPAARDAAAYAEAIAFVEQRARAQRAVFVLVDGDGWTGPGEVEAARQTLIVRRWRVAASQPQFRNTGLSRIDKDDAALLAEFKPKWRYNLRLAERRGVVARLATEADWPALLEMYAETGRRDGFVTRPAAYYTDAWRTMQGQAILAEREGEALAGLVLFRHGPRAWYFYGMSRTEGREHMPNHALQWAALRWARDAGVTPTTGGGRPTTKRMRRTGWPGCGVSSWALGLSSRPA
ncbi:MAG: peptidoglycan bridge formation glycyltransferase FemA/FemB family protein [Anaerolineae bacterium]|nr:peptidoglycan bridge formation glycyltransferase FemA/FemB family protein [Anaerolineae bacterium]